MKKSILLLTIIVAFQIGFAQNSASLTYKFDEVNKKIYYEKVYELEGKTAAEIKNTVLKILAAEMIQVNFADEKDVYAFGDFVTIYKNGSNKTDFRMSCRIHFFIKDNKLKFYASNFLLRPKNVVATSNSVTIIDGLQKSTMNTPNEKYVEVFYPRKTSPKNKLFPDMNRIMNDIMNKILAELNPSNNW
jgi:hypothetical protein